MSLLLPPLPTKATARLIFIPECNSTYGLGYSIECCIFPSFSFRHVLDNICTSSQCKWSKRLEIWQNSTKQTSNHIPQAMSSLTIYSHIDWEIPTAFLLSCIVLIERVSTRLATVWFPHDLGKRLCLRLKCSVTTDLPNVNGVGFPSSVFILISTLSISRLATGT